MINSKGKPHKFLATVIAQHEQTVPVPSPHAVTILDVAKKPKTFAKGVLTSDTIIIDLLSGVDLDEAELIVKLLRQPPTEQLIPSKPQTLILITTALVWSKTPGDGVVTDDDFMKRTPMPKFQAYKNLENLAMSAAKSNKNLRVHIVCSGMPYGNGESNEVFYEFFRRAWLSLHPDLAALPVIGNGDNFLPTIHVTDLARCIRCLCEEQAGQKAPFTEKQYLMAVDNGNRTQKQIMQSISSGLGSGAVKQVELCDVLAEDWAEFMTLNLRMKMSEEFINLDNGEKWHCLGGIGEETFRLLNEEFNMFRGLFPLKVFIGGPPAVGKTHYANKLADSYGIPHLTMAGMVDHAVKEESNLGDKVRAKIEILKDNVLEDYEKTRKKKDPDLNRDDIKPRLPESVICQIVQARIESPACMNKGFILDGFPKNQNNAQAVFYQPIAGYVAEEPEEGKTVDALEGKELHKKILPQYTICLDADDAFLK